MNDQEMQAHLDAKRELLSRLIEAHVLAQETGMSTLGEYLGYAARQVEGNIKFNEKEWRQANENK